MNLSPDWRSSQSDTAKLALWAANAGARAAPLQMWYWADGFRAEDVSDALLAMMRDLLWKGRTSHIVINSDLVVEGGAEGTFLRVNVPGRFVPSFVHEGRTFVAVRALGDGIVDFSVLRGDGSAPSVRVPMRTEHTVFQGGAGRDDAPPPKALLRGARERAEAASPVLPRPVAPAVPPVRAPEASAAPPPDDPTTDHAPASPPVGSPRTRPVVRPRHGSLAAQPAPVAEEVVQPTVPPVSPSEPVPTPPVPRSVLDDDLPPVTPLPIGLLLAFAAGIFLILAAVAYVFS